MEMYKSYIKEREGKELLYNDKGFCTYEITGEYVYLIDVYVKPEYRKNNVATDFMNEVADISKECTQMITSYSTIAENWQSSKKVIQSRGFKYYTENKDENMVYLIKEIR